MNLITPEIKDSLLKTLCENAPFERLVSFSPSDLGDHDFDIINAILLQFQRMGLIESLNARRNTISLILLLDAQDFLRIGGFQMREVAAKQAFEKLKLELNNLQDDFPEKTATFTTIFAGLATIGTFLMGK